MASVQFTASSVPAEPDFVRSDGYVASPSLTIAGDLVAELFAPNGRQVSRISRTANGTWTTRSRGKSYRGRSLASVAQRICKDDAVARSTPGRIGADTLKQVMHLYDDDRVFSGSHHIGVRIVERIFEALQDDPTLPSAIDLRPLYPAARAWEKHVMGYRVHPIFRDKPLSTLSGCEVADLLGEMIDDGITNVGMAEEWFRGNVHAVVAAIPASQPTFTFD